MFYHTSVSAFFYSVRVISISQNVFLDCRVEIDRKSHWILQDRQKSYWTPVYKVQWPHHKYLHDKTCNELSLERFLVELAFSSANKNLFFRCSSRLKYIIMQLFLPRWDHWTLQNQTAFLWLGHIAFNKTFHWLMLQSRNTSTAGKIFITRPQ